MRFERLNKEALMKLIPADVKVELEGATYTVPRAQVPVLVTMGWGLVAHAPEDLTPVEAEALGDVNQACEVADLVLVHNTMAGPQVDVRGTRLEVIRQIGSMRGVVRAMMKSTTAEDAARAKDVHASLFHDLPALMMKTPRETWHAVRMMEDKLGATPELRAKLDELIPPSMTDGLFTGLRALGDAVGTTKEVGEVQPVDLSAMQSFVRRRMTRYVAAVISTAKPDDAVSRQRAERALRPIVELRAELARRRGKRTKAEAEVLTTAPPAVTPVGPAVTPARVGPAVTPVVAAPAAAPAPGGRGDA